MISRLLRMCCAGVPCLTSFVNIVFKYPLNYVFEARCINVFCFTSLMNLLCGSVKWNPSTHIVIRSIVCRSSDVKRPHCQYCFTPWYWQILRPFIDGKYIFYGIEHCTLLDCFYRNIFYFFQRYRLGYHSSLRMLRDVPGHELPSFFYKVLSCFQ